ncbi:RNA polymerase sigma-70 factor (ECF subfamily) [Rubricella aquisinus]|uniref:RNA polymerase sigma-70 factor (ECF subfamily) n=2 Tax=Rubricella aquisinus TaxID=2028108 RepID=A0A840X4E7_9RHOB|nr:RNA polymerase sigma factor [Rubricella aquisinus]MBB5515547.1 RNA polymerase sigma-70 factor (ECF subfamily) [Rubricella aquisinus]
MTPNDPYPDVDDDTLVARYAMGDQSAARALTTRHASRLIALGYRMLGDRAEAEDVAQEALMRLWKTAADWQAGGAKLSTWLYRVASNLCIDRLRRARSEPLDAAPEQIDEAPSVEARLQTQSRAAALHAALATLPERQRLAVSLRFLDDLANPEIADIMELSVDAVESLLARGKRALAAQLRPMGDAL